MDKTYKVSELRRIISESSSEFKAKLGDGVESNNKTNSDKAYDDAKKRAKDFDGGLQEKEDATEIEKEPAGNKTTLDYNPENITDAVKERIKAQAEGYTSVKEKENGIEKAGDFSKNEKIYNAIKKAGQEYHKNTEDFKATGLQAREMPKDQFKKPEMYENKVKTVFFKKTEFLSESIMMSKIPDEFKSEGSVFKMKDKTGNEYLLEWKNNRAKVISHSNKQGLDESISRMKELMGYKTQDTQTSMSGRLNENREELDRTIDLMRKINKK